MHDLIVMKKIEKLKKQVKDFNKNHPIGCVVLVKQDDDSVKQWTVRSKAVILEGHTAVGFFEETSGCYDLDRVLPKPNIELKVYGMSPQTKYYKYNNEQN